MEKKEPSVHAAADDETDVRSLYARHGSYWDVYGGSVLRWLAVTLGLGVALAAVYVRAHAAHLRQHWATERCKPEVMPFAAWIWGGGADATAENFAFCTQRLLQQTAATALRPLTTVTGSLVGLAGEVQTNLQSVRGMFDRVRQNIAAVAEDVYNRLLQVVAPMLQLVVSTRDFLAKLQGMATAAMFTSIGAYITLQSLLGSIAQIIVTVLVALAAMIAAFWATPLTWGAAAANTAIFAGIAVPFALVLAFMKDTMHIDAHYRIPKVKCVHPDTPVRLADGRSVRASDLVPGDTLRPADPLDTCANVVEAVVHVVAFHSAVYNLHGVLVSDSHWVFARPLRRWVRVAEHPDARYVRAGQPDERLVCIACRHKRFWLGADLYCDWDDLHGPALEHAESIVPRDAWAATFHRGWSPNTLVKLHHERLAYLDTVRIGEQVWGGGLVYGTVALRDGRRHLLVTDGRIPLDRQRHTSDFNGALDQWLASFPPPQPLG